MFLMISNAISLFFCEIPDESLFIVVRRSIVISASLAITLLLALNIRSKIRRKKIQLLFVIVGVNSVGNLFFA